VVGQGLAHGEGDVWSTVGIGFNRPVLPVVGNQTLVSFLACCREPGVHCALRSFLELCCGDVARVEDEHCKVLKTIFPLALRRLEICLSWSTLNVVHPSFGRSQAGARIWLAIIVRNPIPAVQSRSRNGFPRAKADHGDQPARGPASKLRPLVFAYAVIAPALAH
jgi:hypothetical protein